MKIELQHSFVGTVKLKVITATIFQFYITVGRGLYFCQCKHCKSLLTKPVWKLTLIFMFKILRYTFMFWVLLLLPLRNLIKANLHSNNSILLLYITWNKHLAHLWFYHSNISSIKIELNMTKSLFDFTDESFFYQGIADPNTTKSKMKQKKRIYLKTCNNTKNLFSSL